MRYLPIGFGFNNMQHKGVVHFSRKVSYYSVERHFIPNVYMKWNTMIKRNARLKSSVTGLMDENSTSRINKN